MDRRKRTACRLMALILVFAMSVGMITSQAETTGATASRYNVVFVLDASGSMKQTDTALWRYEAMDLFLGLATDEGNRIGAVIFNEGIAGKIDLQEVNGKAMKEQISQTLRNSPVAGDTDIGTAIQLAATMLDEGRDTSLPSAIILLSDGNTDLPSDTTGQLLAQSSANKQDAINRARANTYPIYSICLNANGAANPAELADISNATGGVFMEVNNAEDLKDVFAKFYNMIYTTETIPLVDGAIPDGGVMDIPFKVPSTGVEEVNIIFSTLSQNASYSVFQPTGLAYTADELAAMTVKAQTFSVIKIPTPEGGDWKIQVRGIPGDAVKIDMVYNSDFKVDIDWNQSGEIAKGTEVHFTAKILENDGQSADAAAYGSARATLSVYRSIDNSEVSTTDMTVASDISSFEADVKIEEDGDLYAVARINLDGMEKNSNHLNMTVSGEAKQQTTAAAKPSKPAKPAKKINPKTIISVIGGIVGVILLAVIALILMKRLKKNVYKGDIMSIAFDNNTGMIDTPQTIRPKEGKVPMGRYLSEGGGIDLRQNFFLADASPDYIWIISKNGLYSSENPDKKEKKIRLYNGMEVTLSKNRDLDCGIQITYTADQM